MMIDEWHDKHFWPAYPADLCHNKKGSKVESRNAMKKINPDEGQRDKILADMQAHIRYDRKCLKANEKVDRWTHAVRYVKYEKWSDEIPSHSDLQDKVNAHKCQCGRDSKHKGGYCDECWTKKYKDRLMMRDERIEHWKRKGLGQRKDETRPDYIERMKQSAKNLGYSK